MANIVENYVRFYGKEEDVRKARESVYTRVDDEDGHENLFDLKKIVPMPKELEGTTADTYSMFMYDLEAKAKGNAHMMKVLRDRLMQPHEYKSIMLDRDHPSYGLARQIDDFMKYGGKEKFIEETDKKLEVYGKTGCVDWYEWTRKNWGTKWNVSDSREVDKDTVFFITANSSPYKALEKFAEQNPKVMVAVWSVDYGIGLPASLDLYVAGKDGKCHGIQARTGEADMDFFHGNKDLFDDVDSLFPKRRVRTANRDRGTFKGIDGGQAR